MKVAINIFAIWPKLRKEVKIKETKIKERTGYLCDIHSRTVLLRKEAKRCGSPHKIRVMYEIKGNNKEVYS